MKSGSGFLIAAGWIVTNEHVINGCDANEVIATSARSHDIYIARIVVDASRDLALLIPQKKLDGGLSLGTDKGLKLGSLVSAWGFPFVYDGPSPVLSVGYIAGFDAYHPNPGVTVKHIVVNGAYNPGNSGGPLFLADDDKVIGVVVWKALLVSNDVPIIVNGLEHSNTRTSGGLARQMPDGSVQGVSNEEAIGHALNEFYNSVQVMIGEVIAVSELQAFVREKADQLK